MVARPARHRYCRCGTHLAADNTEHLCARCERASRDKLIAPPEVPADFWQTEQFRDAFAAQHMGRVARAYRTHLTHHAVYGPDGISQTLLGQWLGLGQPQISRIESGPPIRNLDTLAYWARTLRIPTELLWFDLPGEKRQLRTAEPAARDLATPASNGALELPTLRWATDLNEARQSAAALSGYALEDSRIADAVNTTVLSGLTLHWLVASSDSPASQGTGAPRAGLGDVMRIGEVRCQLKALDNAHGGGIAFPMAVT